MSFTLAFLNDSGSSSNALVLSGAAVLTVLFGLGYAFRRLYEDKMKAEAAHIDSERRRADEAIARANELEKLLREHRENILP